MKYMGSKRWMLRNGLGHLIQEEIKTSERFIDLFTGSGAVAQFAATAKHSIEVRAYDLQLFSVVLADAVIARDSVLNSAEIWQAWHRAATQHLRSHGRDTAAFTTIPSPGKFTRAHVEGVREQCEMDSDFHVTAAYGGHYFSQAQALWLDALRATLPKSPLSRTSALAALIRAASQCAASPGHTAQPFQPTRSAKRFIYEAWQRDIVSITKQALEDISAVHANEPGGAKKDDANAAASHLKEGDLVFMDPPYSGVHYSRFYHVLETIAAGQRQEVSGIGRYPPPAKRPRSRYSVASESTEALDDLLKKIAAKGARGLLTFPEHDCSNGLSGEIVEMTAAKYFKVQRKSVKNRFSTLGGTKSATGIGYGREARQMANELIFVLDPR
jgi:adenine-specific DNA-methyltransferase